MLSNRFNEMVNWVKTAILTTERPKERASVVKRFLELAMLLKEMRNYNAVLAIAAGIEVLFLIFSFYF